MQKSSENEVFVSVTPTLPATCTTTCIYRSSRSKPFEIWAWKSVPFLYKVYTSSWPLVFPVKKEVGAYIASQLWRLLVFRFPDLSSTSNNNNILLQNLDSADN
jgi:hypothetical protein